MSPRGRALLAGALASLLMPTIPPASAAAAHSSNSLALSGGHPVLIDGANGSGALEWADAEPDSFAGPGAPVNVMAKHATGCLAVLFNVSDTSNFGTDRADVYLDADHSAGGATDADDRWYWVERGGGRGRLVGTGGTWSPDSSVQWQGGAGSRPGGWIAEFCIPYADLGLVSGSPQPIGLELGLHDAYSGGADDYFWSAAADPTVPSTWGDASSPDDWDDPSPVQRWRQIAPAMPGGGPDPRYNARAVYDDSNDTLLVFGGYHFVGGRRNDTWLLANATGRTGAPEWKQLFANGAPGSPTPRHRHVMTFDEKNNRLTLFGGDGPVQKLNDVWVLSNANGKGGAPTWTRRLADGLPGSPDRRDNHFAVHDPTSNRLVVTAGVNNTGWNVNDVWALTRANGLGGSSSWVTLLPNNPAADPSYRTGQHTVYATASNRMVLFSGVESKDDVWALKNATGTTGTPEWERLLDIGAPGSPGKRWGFAAGLAPSTDRMVIFGGCRYVSGPSCDYPDDVHVLRDATGIGGTPTWRKVIPAGAPGSPGSRPNLAGAHGAGHDVLLVFGGLDGAFQEKNDSWVLENATALPPSAPVGSNATLGNLSVLLTWSPVADDPRFPVSGYRVYRSTASGQEMLLAELGNVTGYNDTNVSDGVTYYYRVSAVSAVGEGEGSAEISATPVLIPHVPWFPLVGLVTVIAAWAAIIERRPARRRRRNTP